MPDSEVQIPDSVHAATVILYLMVYFWYNRVRLRKIEIKCWE